MSPKVTKNSIFSIVYEPPALKTFDRPSSEMPQQSAEDKAAMRVGTIILALNIALTVALIVMDKPPQPPDGETLPGAAIGWVSVFSAVFIFGCYGVLIKAPAVDNANVDAMVFQLYFSAGCAVCSALIWLAGSSRELAFTTTGFAWGVIFALVWNVQNCVAYDAIQQLGYAVAPSIWAGLTIVVSFFWGSVAFGNPVPSAVGAAAALLILVSGVCLAASSQSSFPETVRKWVEARQGGGGGGGGGEEHREELLRSANDNEEDGADAKGAMAGKGSKSFAKGATLAAFVGLCNGSLMVPMTCFGEGCFGAAPFDAGANGNDLTSVAFLPYLSLGLIVATPVVFFFRFKAWNGIEHVKFHFDVAALPGFLTGCYWYVCAAALCARLFSFAPTPEYSTTYRLPPSSPPPPSFPALPPDAHYQGHGQLQLHVRHHLPGADHRLPADANLHRGQRILGVRPPAVPACCAVFVLLCLLLAAHPTTRLALLPTASCITRRSRGSTRWRSFARPLS